MTSQGHPYARFRRLLKAGDATGATATAHDLPHVPLEDALRLVLLYRQAGDARYERAALRFHQRICQECPALGLSGAAVALQALAAIGRGEEAGVEALHALFEQLGIERLVAILN